MNKFNKIVRNMVIKITPPIIIAGLRKVRDHFILRHTQPSLLPPPSEYSTADSFLEVPCQVESYLLCRDKYLEPTDFVLDVGFGLGYGLHIMAAKVENIVGIEVDQKTIERAQRIFEGHPHIKKIILYNGKRLPFKDKTFDVVTCIEVLEHVEDYKSLLLEMARISKRLIFITTPNQRPEHTLPDGRPKNYWHLREWMKGDLDTVFAELGCKVQWNFLNGSFGGPFTVTGMPTEDTLSLIPIILLERSGEEDE